MIVSIYTELLMAACATLLLWWLFFRFLYPRMKQDGIKTKIAWMFILAGLTFIVPRLIFPMVKIVTKSPSGFETSDVRVMFGFTTVDGTEHPVKPCGRYLYNDSNETLVLYPVYYSPDDWHGNDGDDINDDATDDATQYIGPGAFINFDHKIDYIFTQPDDVVYFKPDEEHVKWALQSISDYRTISDQ